MNLKQFLIVMGIATVVCWIGWIILIFKVDPTDSGFVEFMVFYFSLFLSLLGSFFLLTFAVRKLFNKLDMDYKIVAVSFRQSIFFAGLFVLVLFLQSMSLLAWWNLLIIVLALCLLEFFFLSGQKRPAWCSGLIFIISIISFYVIVLLGGDQLWLAGKPIFSWGPASFQMFDPRSYDTSDGIG